MRRLALVSAIALSLPGCHLYFGGGDDDCDDITGVGPAEDAVGLRNPWTGQCEYVGGGGGGGTNCGDWGGGGGDYYEEPDREAPEMYDWGMCTSHCTGLDSWSCMATPGCQAGEVGGDFYECWAIAPSGPAEGTCEGLDAYECSRREHCRAIHEPGSGGGTDPGGSGGDEADPVPVPPPPGAGEFLTCAAEPVMCYGDEECAAGERCNAADVCVSGCGGTPGDPGDPTDPDTGVPCDDACRGFCVPGDAPPPPPPPPPPPKCEDLADETACIAAVECTPLYEGIDCTCDEAGCACADWIFIACTG